MFGQIFFRIFLHIKKAPYIDFSTYSAFISNILLFYILIYRLSDYMSHIYIAQIACYICHT